MIPGSEFMKNYVLICKIPKRNLLVFFFSFLLSEFYRWQQNSFKMCFPILNSRLNLFIRFLSLSFHSKFNISVVNKLQGRHDWQGPQVLGLTWISHYRKRGQRLMPALPAKNWLWLSWDYFWKTYITSSSNMLIFPMQVDICDELPLFVCQASGFFPVMQISGSDFDFVLAGKS